MSVLLIIVGLGGILFSTIKLRQLASHIPRELLEETAGTGIIPSWLGPPPTWTDLERDSCLIGFLLL